MARENQGLQVLLIIFVMLTVVLGVTTYLYNKQAFEKTNAAVAAEGKVQQTNTEKAALSDEVKSLKTLLGLPEQTTDAIKKQFDDDQKTAGVSTSGEGDQKQVSVMGYHQMVEALSKTVDARTGDLRATKDQVAMQQETFKTREAAKDNAIAKIDSGYNDVRSSIAKVEHQYTENLQTSQAEMAKASSDIARIKSSANAEKVAAEDKVKAAQQAAAAAENEARGVQKKLREIDRPPQTDAPSGVITWVSIPEKTVSINRGRADSLQRGTRFTVYAGDSNTSATAVKKGTVEVTRVTADHQAECKIIDDKLTDPMMAGDAVFTPLWSPGQQNHYALAGIMNLDGDGRNQVNAVVGLINDSGGVVDCWLDEQGHRQGQVTGNTQYILIGDPPDKGSQEMVKNNGDILHDAERHELHKMSLAEFKQKMNYQKSSSVEHFGSGASTTDLQRAASAAKAKAAAKAPAPATKATDDKGGGDDFK